MSYKTGWHTNAFSHAWHVPIGKSVPAHYSVPLEVIVFDQPNNPHICMQFCPRLRLALVQCIQ